jgi:hypothetical protein
MRTRLLALFALLALGLVPAVGAAVGTPPPPGSPVVLVKAYSTVVGVTSDATGTRIELAVEEAHEWVDGTEAKTLATGINGQNITAAVTADSRFYRNEQPIGLGDLRPGMKIKALLQTDGTPVTTTCTFTLLQAWHSVPKPHPGTKFESAFFPRLWHTRGQILGMDRVEDRNVLNLDVRRLEHAPRRFRDEGVRLTHLDAYVIVPARVVITDVNGRRITFEQLNVDDRIKVVGKFVRPALWMRDEAGEPTPTLLAKRIKVKVRAPQAD